MIAYPLNDEDCLYQVTAHAIAAMERPDVRELAARLGTTASADAYLRRLPQREDGPEDTTCGPRVPCDVPQRVRVMASDPNCVERSLLRLALGELIDPRPIRQLMTIEVAPGVRHTLPVEDGEPVWLDPLVASPRTLSVGLHLVRNARGERSVPLTPVDALSWAVSLAGDLASSSVTWAKRHERAIHDVTRIASGLLPIEPAALTWALKLAVPEALAFGPDGASALMAAAGLLDNIAGTSASGTPKPVPGTSAPKQFDASASPGTPAPKQFDASARGR
jgi:hypothetical protein